MIILLSPLFLLESEHMPSLSYSQSLKSSGVSFRQEAVSFILKASSRFDPFLSYLAVNYLDRFLSTQG
ncbi:Putative cyclin-D6-1, partial [Linum perenne]